MVGLFGSFPLYPFCVRAALTDLETTHSLLAQTIDHDRRRVDDVDVEVDGVAIRPGSDVVERLARRSPEIAGFEAHAVERLDESRGTAARPTPVPDQPRRRRPLKELR